MAYVLARNVSRQTELGRKVRVAASLLERAVGLLATEKLSMGEGIYLAPCKSIHTFFMRYPIDVLFLDEKGAVLHQKTYRPWRVSGWYGKSQGVLEFAEGTLSRSGTCVGDRVEMKGITG